MSELISIAELEQLCNATDLDVLCKELLWGSLPSRIVKAAPALLQLARAANHYVEAKLAANDADSDEELESIEEYADGQAWDRLTGALVAFKFPDGEFLRCACACDVGDGAMESTPICGEFRLGPATPSGDEEDVCEECAHSPECHEPDINGVQLPRQRPPIGYESRAFTDGQWLQAFNRMAQQRDAAVTDAAAYRALRAEAEAATAYSENTGMKVARPPRMSPATVKIIMEARKP